MQADSLQIWKTQQWPHDWKRSVFIPIPKKGNAKECSNYHLGGSQAPRRAVCGTRGSLRTMHGGGSAPSCTRTRPARSSLRLGSRPGPASRGRPLTGPLKFFILSAAHGSLQQFFGYRPAFLPCSCSPRGFLGPAPVAPASPGLGTERGPAFSKASSRPRNLTRVSCIAGRFFTLARDGVSRVISQQGVVQGPRT